METAITALIIIGVMVLGILTISERSLTAQAVVSQATRTMQEREAERARTNLSVIDTSTSGGGDSVQVTLKNAGLTKLADFDHWDVILEYSDGGTRRSDWYPHGSGTNTWNEQIYQVAPSVPETLNPGILDPGEEIMVTVEVAPPVAVGTTSIGSVSTPNGITATAIITH